jgi:predicted MFS family arabinose efflux permease
LKNRWPNCRALPPGPKSALAALHLTAPRFEPLRALTAAQWREALDYCDAERLSLVLRDVAREAMPEEVRARVDERSAKSTIRARKFEELYRELHATLTAAGLDFIALKGLAHAGTPGRVQYDIDLYLPPETVHRAQEILIAAGRSPLAGMDSFPTDHLPALLPPRADWKWVGDYFDPGLPIGVELHFRFWNDETERVRASGTDEFWTRRVKRPIAGVEMGALSPPDTLAYASLHLLRHVFCGSVYAFHVYEIARMLQAREGDAAFWAEWRSTQSDDLRRLQAIVFRLAQEWFGCPAPETEPLPDTVESWFEPFALSPATQRFRSNKDHLWLQLALVESRADAWRVIRRRMLPANLPPLVGASHGSPRIYLTHVAARLRHHAISLPRTALSGIRFWSRIDSLGRQFWRFTAAAVVFDFGLFIFFLHYNLFLLDLGFREDFVGTVNSATRIGSMAGTVPAAYVAQRLGLRTALLLTIAATVVAECLRAVVGARFPLAALGFLSGCTFAVWAVILAPLIAAAVPEKSRPAAYSLFFACMFATGIAGNWAGGLLPLWIHSRRILLLGSAALSVTALVPALRLREMPRPPAEARVWPRNRFLALYLAPFAIWHLGTGAFNPFNNVYFKRLGFADRQIGSVFAGSQFAQIATLLFAPAIIRRLGLVPAISAMMAATALAMVALAARPSESGVVLAYLAYTSFQWMSEPGLNALLMNSVEERERNGASALNYVVAFGAQAVAAFAGGLFFTQFGYGPGLAASAGLALLAALLFPALLRRRGGDAPA